MRIIETEWATYKFDDSDEMARKVFERVIEFMKDNNLFSGESINQCDMGMIGSVEAMSDIADDILKAEYISKEE